MKLQTILVVLCTIAVLFIELNHGAPTKSASEKSTTTKKTPTTKAQKTTPKAKEILVGGHTPWETKIKPKHQKIFNDYKKIILKKLKETHKVPDSFVPKADKFSTQVVGGINYLFLVKLPTNKYAFISIYDVVWKKGRYGKEENVHIRPETYELNDKTV